MRIILSTTTFVIVAVLTIDACQLQARTLHSLETLCGSLAVRHGIIKRAFPESLRVKCVLLGSEAASLLFSLLLSLANFCVRLMLCSSQQYAKCISKRENCLRFHLGRGQRQ